MKNIAFIIFLLFISICRAQDNNILFQNYNVSNGLSQNTVIRSLEDSNGVMWFCTRDGLNRFDGTEFEVFAPTVSRTPYPAVMLPPLLKNRPEFYG